jgi:uncharacterized membrane protein
MRFPVRGVNNGLHYLRANTKFIEVLWYTSAVKYVWDIATRFSNDAEGEKGQTVEIVGVFFFFWFWSTIEVVVVQLL